MGVMEMRRMTENIEKERKAYLGPSWTKDARDQEDLADLRRYNTKLGDCQAMHRWEVQRMPKPAVSPSRRPGRMSSTTSVMAELAQGVPEESSQSMRGLVVAAGAASRSWRPRSNAGATWQFPLG